MALTKSGTRTGTKSYLPNEVSSHFAIHTVDHEIIAATSAAADDCFMTKTPSLQDLPLRLSQVFTPIPTAACFGAPPHSSSRDYEDDVRPKRTPSATMSPTAHIRVRKQAIGTPTPSPKHHERRVPSIVPPPQILRPMTSSPTRGGSRLAVTETFSRRQPSPVESDGSLSSVYDGDGVEAGGESHSISASGESSAATTLNHSTATLITVPSRERLAALSSNSLLRQHYGPAGQGEDREQHDTSKPNTRPRLPPSIYPRLVIRERDRLPSDASLSVYSTPDPDEEADRNDDHHDDDDDTTAATPTTTATTPTPSRPCGSGDSSTSRSAPRSPSSRAA
jgi:hypothetical protein